MNTTNTPPSDADQTLFCETVSRLEEREPVILQILEAVHEKGFRPDLYLHRLCIDEALTNAILHGNSGDPAKQVTIRAFCSATSWGVEIADQGAGFDWQSWSERLEKGHQLVGSSGRGIALILNSDADVEFLDDGSRIRLVWRYDAAPASQPEDFDQD